MSEFDMLPRELATSVLRSNEFRKWYGLKKGDKCKFLGNGVFGYAWLMPNNRVLKLTSGDPSEYKTALLIKQDCGSLARVVKPYRVARVAGLYIPVSAIVSEYAPRSLKPTEKVLANIFANCIEEYEMIHEDEEEKSPWDTIWTVKYLDEFLEWCYDNREYLTEQYKDFCNGNLDVMIRNYDFLKNLYGIINSFNKAGIHWHDMHCGNIKYNAKGKLVAIDYGCTTFPYERLKLKPERIAL
jgi:hypothetical protein